jgi:hypothetical protein
MAYPGDRLEALPGRLSASASHRVLERLLVLRHFEHEERSAADRQEHRLPFSDLSAHYRPHTPGTSGILELCASIRELVTAVRGAHTDGWCIEIAEFGTWSLHVNIECTTSDIAPIVTRSDETWP